MADHIFNKRALMPDFTQRNSDPLRGGYAMAAGTVGPSPVLRMVVGRDQAPHPMTEAELGTLNDSFARMVLHRGTRPMRVDSLLAELDAQSENPIFADCAVPIQQTFLAGDGGQISLAADAAGLDRSLRFVVARTGATRECLVLMSVDDQPWSATGLMQVLSWDLTKKTYNFYQRTRGQWTYAGDGYDALHAPTRGLGPFDGHVNGGLVMKELREPWVHWNSMSASIPPEVFGPDHPIRQHRLMQDLAGAEILERDIIVPGLDGWTDARLDRAITDGHITDATPILRQIIHETTMNIVSAHRPYDEVAPGIPVNVPAEVFVNREAFAFLYQEPVVRGRVQVDGGHLLGAVADLGIQIADGGTGFAQPGETFFALTCPSPAYEDLSVLRAVLEHDVLGVDLVRAMLAVDFMNPIASRRRAGLVRHMPRAGETGRGPGSIHDQLIRNLERAAAIHPTGDEAWILGVLSMGNGAVQSAHLRDQIAAYYDAVKARAATPEGVHDILRLIQSRRRYFRRFGVSEFPLTFPVSSLPPNAPPVRMTRTGLIEDDPELLS